MHELSNITPARLGLELQDPLADQAWYLLQAADPRAALLEIVETLEGAEVAFVHLPAADPKALLAAGSATGIAGVVVETRAWTDDAYQELDRMRHAVRERWPVLIWLSDADGVRRLVHQAPNFAAFFNATTAPWSPGTMSSEVVDEHLRDLRARWDMSDEAFIAAVQSGVLGSDPEHHLWLILLGRGDLIDAPDADGDV